MNWNMNVVKKLLYENLNSQGCNENVINKGIS